MDYSKAARIRKTGLVSLIAKNKFEKGQGIGSSIGGAISDKFKARITGFQQMIDPLNWVSKMTGKGTFGKIATTLAGRAFGRSDETIDYYGGYRRRKTTVNPRFTKISAGSIRALRVGDSGADILGKMYNFMKKSSDEDRERNEILQTFRQEKLDKDERRHKQLIQAIKKFKGGEPIKETEKNKSSLFDFLKNLLPDWLGDLLGGLMQKLLPFLLSGLVAELLLKLKDILGLPFVPRLPTNIKPPPSMKPSESLKTPETNDINSGKVPPKGVSEEPVKSVEESKPVRKPFKDKVVEQRSLSPREKFNQNLERMNKFNQTSKAPTAEPVKKFDMNKFTKAFSKFNTGSLKTIFKILEWMNNKIPGVRYMPAFLTLGTEVYDTFKLLSEGVIDGNETIKRCQDALAGALGGFGGGELGAALGAAGGTAILPGWGTLIGGAAGGILGYAAGDKLARAIWDYYAGGKPPPPVGNDFYDPESGMMAQPVSVNKNIPNQLPDTGAGAGRGGVMNSTTVNSVKGDKPQVITTSTPKSRMSDILRYSSENAAPY
jgi:hypothetical protein